MANRILVVDDNPLNTKLMKVVLEAGGHLVDTAIDADEARVAVGKQIPDLILMDLQMPKVDGYTLTTELKARAELKAVPIIAVTASAMRGDEQRALNAGCDGYVTKPIDTRAFSAMVAKMLANKRTDELKTA